MNLNIKNHSMNTLFVFSALSVFSNVGHAESSTVLDSSQHPVSPEHQTVFSTTMIHLDATLSWTERFNGNESFNDNQVLAQATTETDGMTSEESMMQEIKMDARGMVKVVRMNQGKVKIEHGPIDKYGMPGMTMMFKVTDPAQLEGLEPGASVDFDVDNSSGGFVITDIKQVDE
jgi:Cu/Ag efflux protein CusF